MKKTAKQLAEELGVSATTVSMVLRGNGNISEATRKRVLEAAKEAGMSLPVIKENVKKTEPLCNFALICSNYNESVANTLYPNPMVMSTICEFGNVCLKENARLMTVFSFPDNPENAPFDGYFVFGGESVENVGVSARNTRKPVVFVDSEPKAANSVTFDQEGSMVELADFICKKGYKRPFFFYFDHIHPKFKRSWLLLDDHLSRYGIYLETMYYNENGEISGSDVDRQWNNVRECAELLSNRKSEERPDVILCSNDCFAGMLQLEMRKLGIEIGSIDQPDVIPLIGFDDIPYVPGAGLFTTFHTDTKALADAAMRLMNDLLEDTPNYIRHVKITPKMIVR